MKELKAYYNRWRERLLFISIPIWALLAFISFCINEKISTIFDENGIIQNIVWITQDNKMVFSYIFSLLIDFIAPTSIVVTLYLIIINYINRKSWKKKFPHLDVSGEWLDTTTYTREIGKTGWKQINERDVPSPVRINQTCLKIEILPSIGENFMWHSLLADWNDDNNLKILYEVEYYGNLQGQGFPERRIGCESMYIYTNDFSENKRPYKMVGKFWHCISYDGAPMYMGCVTYERNRNC